MKFDIWVIDMVKYIIRLSSNVLRKMVQLIRVNPCSSVADNSSFFDLSSDLAGSVDGPSDLSTNKDHYNGYGI